MDFTLGEDQEAIRGLAAQIFGRHATIDRVKEVERRDDRFDRELWKTLAEASLLGVALPEDLGGSGLGLLELCALLEEQGRAVAPVPLWPTLALGALPIARFGTPGQQAWWLPGVASGEVVLSAALSEAGSGDPLRPRTRAVREGSTWRIEGTKVCVPAGHLARGVLVPARTGERSVGVFVVDPAGPGVERQPAVTTDREMQAHLILDGARGETLGDPAQGAAILEWLLDRALVGLCAIQVGVAEAALRITAEYTSNRLQFGKPLSSFQGVALRAADAYIDTEAMRVTMWQAAWRLATGRDARREVMVAKWWAAESGHRVGHATQHLHGGMGVDIDYPVHRYFLWAKQIENTLGGASYHLARLGGAIAEAPASADA